MTQQNCNSRIEPYNSPLPDIDIFSTRRERLERQMKVFCSDFARGRAISK